MTRLVGGAQRSGVGSPSAAAIVVTLEHRPDNFLVIAGLWFFILLIGAFGVGMFWIPDYGWILGAVLLSITGVLAWIGGRAFYRRARVRRRRRQARDVLMQAESGVRVGDRELVESIAVLSKVYRHDASRLRCERIAEWEARLRRALPRIWLERDAVRSLPGSDASAVLARRGSKNEHPLHLVRLKAMTGAELVGMIGVVVLLIGAVGASAAVRGGTLVAHFLIMPVVVAGFGVWTRAWMRRGWFLAFGPPAHEIGAEAALMRLRRNGEVKDARGIDARGSVVVITACGPRRDAHSKPLGIVIWRICPPEGRGFDVPDLEIDRTPWAHPLRAALSSPADEGSAGAADPTPPTAASGHRR